MGEPRGDDLTEINGIGPATVEKLNAEGVMSFAQMAEWDEDEMDRLDIKLGLKGKIRSDDWRGQAKDKLSAAADEDDFEAELDEEPEEAPEKPARATEWLSWPDEKPTPPKKAEQSAEEPEPAEAAPERKSKGKQRRRLDRRKKVSEVYGGYRGAAFMQVLNGKDVYFTAGGVEMFEGEDASDAIGATESPHEVKTWEDVHFLNFLDKKQDVPFPLLRQAMQQRLNRQPKNLKEAKEILHEQFRTNH